MAFKGTERRSARAIAEEIEAVGGHLNAYTPREHRLLRLKVLKTRSPLALDILADILQHSSFDPAEFERERTVILQEIGQANDTPDDIIFDHFQERAFPDQAMGRPVLGSPEIIRETLARGRHHLSARPLRRGAHGAVEPRAISITTGLSLSPTRSCGPPEAERRFAGSRPNRRAMCRRTIARTASWSSCTS